MKHSLDSVVLAKIGTDPIECCQFRMPDISLKPIQSNAIYDFESPTLNKETQEATEECCDPYTDTQPSI